jgi:hypothetical protein
MLAAFTWRIRRIRVGVCNIVVKIVIVVVVVFGVAFGFFIGVAVGVAVELFFLLVFVFFFAVFRACARSASGGKTQVSGVRARIPVSSAFEDFEAFSSDTHVAQLDFGT